MQTIPQAPTKTRIASIDIMRGLTLVLMLFVNDLFVPGVPKWLVHTQAAEDGMGLADWVFPGFLFMVGLSIPFAFISRKKRGENKRKIFLHIIGRTVSLLIIGVFMVNVSTLNPQLTGIGTYTWAILVYLCIFLIWNKYPENTGRQKLYRSLRLTGIAGLILLAFLFRAGTAEDPEWISPQWWGILGLIGWGYFAAAVTLLLTGENLKSIFAVWIGFIALNIFSQLDLLTFLNPIQPYFGVLLSGTTPSIVLCGLLTGVILKRNKDHFTKLLRILIPFGILILCTGFVLRNWFILSKISGTPSWAMVCNGISILVFCILFYIIDFRKIISWGNVFLPAGQNSLTTYLAPDILYFILWGFHLPFFFYKQEHSPLLAVIGSLAWALAMIGLARLLSKAGIRLKL
ncbi:DUF5009 domain-containing protein [Sinomicrobium sp. M5D2P9]